MCEYDIRFGDRLPGLEAAHIRWHSHDGRDVVSNGLALCGVHHKALDLGAMGLEVRGAGVRILVWQSAREESDGEAACGVAGEGDSVAGSGGGRAGSGGCRVASGGGVSGVMGGW